uniref:Uncharacterized protein n=1 Tax=Nomascus leucogenys TaxID=61853 RepID=A0A2I3H5E9_NOMLE
KAAVPPAGKLPWKPWNCWELRMWIRNEICLGPLNTGGGPWSCVTRGASTCPNRSPHSWSWPMTIPGRSTPPRSWRR